MVTISLTHSNTNVKVVDVTPKPFICSNCNEEIGINELHLLFTGERLHINCLIEFMKKLHILDVIIPRISGDENR